jgi:hypothetical protein
MQYLKASMLHGTLAIFRGLANSVLNVATLRGDAKKMLFTQKMGEGRFARNAAMF